VVKARTWFTLFVLSLGTVAATASCGSDEATGGGAGSGGAAGGSVLGGAGKAGSSTGRAGSGGGGTVTGSSLLGAPCASDAACADGMVCANAKSNLFPIGSPANGLCTLPCMSTDECAAVEAGADCFNFGTKNAPKLYCLQGCVQGGNDQATLDAKCQGRGDMICTDLHDPTTTTTPEPFCLPHCSSDADCTSGLFCNKSSGFCSSTKHTGDPAGAPCDPSATTDTCEAFCLTTTAQGVTPAKGVCAEFCSGLLDCSYNGKTPGGLCYGQLTETFGVLDLGYCLPSCSCSGECPIPGDLCRAWTANQSSFKSDLGAPGLCVPDLAGSTELACSDGSAGAGGAVGAAGTPGVSEPGAGAGGASGAGN